MVSTKHENTSGVPVLLHLSLACNFCVVICEINKQKCRASERLRSIVTFISLFGNLPVLMLYQSANDNLSYLR